jgi:hypothetical protein
MLQTIKKEWPAIKRAPFSFISGAVAVGIAVFGVVTWHYSGQVETFKTQLQQKDQEIDRLRVAAGIAAADKSSLMSLSNDELRSKSTLLAARLHQTCKIYGNRMTEIGKKFSEKKINEKSRSEQIEAVDRQMGDEFVRELRADTFNVDNELRRRLGSGAFAIPGISPSFHTHDGTPLDIWTFTSSGPYPFPVMISCELGDMIDQMARILPGER